MNTRDTELIYEAYNKKVIGFNITEKEAAQILENSIEILFNNYNSLIQEAGFIQTAKKIVKDFAAERKEGTPRPRAAVKSIVGGAAVQAYESVLDAIKGASKHKELLKHMAIFIKAAAQNNPDVDQQLINVATSALEGLPQEEVNRIIARFRGGSRFDYRDLNAATLARRQQMDNDEALAARVAQLPRPTLAGEGVHVLHLPLVENMELLVVEGVTREIIKENIFILNTALDIVEENLMDTIKSAAPKALNLLQSALDVAGIDPGLGTIADAGNGIISLLRAAFAKEPDQRKKLLLKAAISAVSMIPGADLIKLLKARKLTKPLAKGALAGAKALRTYKQGQAAAGKADLAAAGMPTSFQGAKEQIVNQIPGFRPPA
jgi:hypothetical protein